MRRRTSLEAALAAKPKRQRQPLGFVTSAETPRIWPYGMHWEEAVEWWGAIGQAKKAAAGNRDRRKAYQHGRAVFPAAPVQISSRKDLKKALRNVRPGSQDNVFSVTARHAANDGPSAGEASPPCERVADHSAASSLNFSGNTSGKPPAVDPCAGGNTSKGQQVKLQKPMIILGQIQQVTEQTMTDKLDKTKVSKMFLVVFADKTRPAQFRTATPFCTFLTEEKFHAQFGAVAESAIDEMVTVAVQEIAPYNAFMKVKGQLIKGHQTGEHLAKMQTEAAAAKAAPPTTSKAAKP